MTIESETCSKITTDVWIIEWVFVYLWVQLFENPIQECFCFFLNPLGSDSSCHGQEQWEQRAHLNRRGLAFSFRLGLCRGQAEADLEGHDQAEEKQDFHDWKDTVEARAK